MSEGKKIGPFVGFVLLDRCEWDAEKLRTDLLADWGIVCPKTQDKNDNLVFDVDGMMVAISFMPGPVPNGEAEQNAANNYMWPEAVEVSKKHKTHLMAAVLDHGKPPLEVGKLYTKVCAACLRQEGAIGVYTAGTVLKPDMYMEVADEMKEDPGTLPLLDWVYFGLYRTEGGLSAYTYGMEAFGKCEIEVLDSKLAVEDLHGFLFDVAYYVLSCDVTLQDGETIGFTEEQKLPITYSKGVALDGMTLKIEY